MSVLDSTEIERFIADGYVRLSSAFSRDVAESCVDVLWPMTGVARDDPTTWTKPIVRVEGSGATPLVDAINAPRLTGALDDLIGAGRWQRRFGYGTFPVRFPSSADPGDAGWHIDGSYLVPDQPPPWNYWVNLWSRQRALLVLMLYSDVDADDAPTRIRVGSHLDMARTLEQFGQAGTSILGAMEACPVAVTRPVAFATGRAGDAYLCHPFLVHAASWPHTGTEPRFMGQPCIHHSPALDGFDYGRTLDDSSPCELAVRLARG